MELQYEHIDWGDIVDAELSGDQETLSKLRDRAAEIKRQNQQQQQQQESKSTHVPGKNGPLSSHNYYRQLTTTTTTTSHTEVKNCKTEPGLIPHPTLDTDEYPLLVKTEHDNKENTSLPFANFSPGPTATTTTTSYAQVVGNRNPKRTLVDRCLSPTDDLPHKRAETFDIMTTPTEYKSFSHHYTSSPSCDATPETSSVAGKAGLVQRRLFGTQTQEKSGPQPAPREPLTDTHRLAQRQKQIDFGKNTLGYERYLQLVPKWKRRKTHPITPNKYNPCSTRSWQGQMKVWRRELHKFDPDPRAQHQFSLADAELCDVKL